MEIKLSVKESDEVLSLRDKDPYLEKTEIQDWFFNHYKAFYEATFRATCDDWGITISEGLRLNNKNLEQDFTRKLLNKSGCLYVFSKEDKEQLKIAKQSLDFLEGVIDRGCENDNTTLLFIRYGDQLESCIEHLKSAVINYAQEHNKGGK